MARPRPRLLGVMEPTFLGALAKLEKNSKLSRIRRLLRKRRPTMEARRCNRDFDSRSVASSSPSFSASETEADGIRSSAAASAGLRTWRNPMAAAKAVISEKATITSAISARLVGSPSNQSRFFIIFATCQVAILSPSDIMGGFR